MHQHNHIHYITTLLWGIATCALCACASIDHMGHIGKNQVYSISSSNFLSASQMILVLNKKGDVAAFTGGTTSGIGTVSLQAGESVLSAGAIAYAGHSVEQGLRHTNISGVPSRFSLKAGLDEDSLKKLKH